MKHKSMSKTLMAVTPMMIVCVVLALGVSAWPRRVTWVAGTTDAAPTRRFLAITD